MNKLSAKAAALALGIIVGLSFPGLALAATASVGLFVHNASNGPLVVTGGSGNWYNVQYGPAWNGTPVPGGAAAPIGGPIAFSLPSTYYDGSAGYALGTGVGPNLVNFQVILVGNRPPPTNCYQFPPYNDWNVFPLFDQPESPFSFTWVCLQLPQPAPGRGRVAATLNNQGGPGMPSIIITYYGPGQ